MFITQAWQDLLFPGNANDFFRRRGFPAFEPDAKGYSPINALWLAELSRLIYRHDEEEDDQPPMPTRTSFLIKAKLRQRQFFLSRETDTQAMLVESTGESPFVVLVFRGTEQTPKDMFIDLNIGKFPLDENDIDVHDGFQKSLDSVWSEIEAALRLFPENGPVFYTGHSLGAALATLAAAKHPPRAVYTFGSPLVGNQKFVDSLNKTPFYRVVDDKDSIATLPPQAMGFRHVGKEQKLTANQGSPSNNQFFDPPKPLSDHAPINYVLRIKLENPA